MTAKPSEKSEGVFEGEQMKVTNRLNLPSAFVRAVSRERHNKPNHFSATTLLKGVKEIVLTLRHFDELEIDASESLFAVFGTAVHAIMEANAGTDDFVEESFETKIGAFTVTGKCDSYDMDAGIVWDWKTASTWKIIMKDFDDWKRQGLIYAYLMRANGLTVNECRFVALLKDYSRTKARTEKDYPPAPVYVYAFPVTESELDKIGAFISEKISGIEKALKLPDEEIPPCTPSERWERGAGFAVKKKGNKRATRILSGRDEAENLAESLGKEFVVEERKGESVKCAGYCPCREFCDFYRRMNGI